MIVFLVWANTGLSPDMPLIVGSLMSASSVIGSNVSLKGPMTFIPRMDVDASGHTKKGACTAFPDGVYSETLTTPVDRIGVLLAAVNRKPSSSIFVHGTLQRRSNARSCRVRMDACAPVSYSSLMLVPSPSSVVLKGTNALSAISGHFGIKGS